MAAAALNGVGMPDNYTKEYEKSFSNLRNILPFFNKYNIDPTPPNYTVLYEYVSGANAQIHQAIEYLEKRGENLTNESCQNFFDEFVKDVNEHNLSQVQSEVSIIMREVLSIISKANQDTTDYGEVLFKNERLLKGKPSFDNLMGMISDLKQGTTTIRERYQNINKALDGQIEEVDELRTRIDKIKKEAGIDYLTQVANRKTLDEYIKQLVKDGNHFCLAMIDIDHFKQFNDNHGHVVGDKVLRFVANIIKNQIKGVDLLARFGGEEFVVLLPDTQLDGATKAADNIRRTIQDTRYVDKKTKKKIGAVTVSIGVTEFHKNISPEKLIENADKALYGAKNNGRNQVQKYNLAM